MGKKELKVEIPGKVYPREWEDMGKDTHPFVTSKLGYRLRVHGGWIVAFGDDIYKKNYSTGHIINLNKKKYIFIPDPNHEWVLEPLKEEPEEAIKEVTDEEFKDMVEVDATYKNPFKELKRNPEKITKKTNKSWFSKLFRSNNG